MVVKRFHKSRLFTRRSTRQGKVKTVSGQVFQTGRACSGFCRMKRLGVFILHPRRDVSPSQSYPQHFKFLLVPMNTPGCESKVYCPRTQHNLPSQGLSPDCFMRSPVRSPLAIAPPDNLLSRIQIF